MQLPCSLYSSSHILHVKSRKNKSLHVIVFRGFSHEFVFTGQITLVFMTIHS